ncbi:hypothetical protein [Chromatium okenii]|uniref:Uncharacterized protein n=1 Tax=Chromatium okenii TaxID=61644 RepID=A0A2S7XV55_9GAMM|nr:hypothetical protein [Chromatium okenii]PQJ97262.1 hypothetical protein CXB77_02945 [Chromatium okenii]
MNWDEEFGVNVRLLAVICGLALLGANLSGCAGNAKNVRTDEIAAEAMNLEAFPQIVLSNAPRVEAKSVAMGAARSKGWIISRSTEDRFIVQRQLDANALADLAADAKFKPGTVLEITSYFVEQAGGTKVATKAELVAPAVSDKPAQRTDYTENLHDALTESLSSLRESWSENRSRLARATPPAEGFKDAWAKDAPPVESRTIREPSQPAQPVASSVATADEASAESDETVEPDMTPVARPPVRPVSPPAPVMQVAPQPVSKPNPPPAAVVKSATPPSVAKVVPPAPQQPSAKPVVATKSAPAVVTPPVVKPAPKLAATTASSATKPAPESSKTKTVAAKPVAAAKPAPAPVAKVAATASAKAPDKSTTSKPAPVVAKPKPPVAKANMMELPKPKSTLTSSVSFAAQAEAYAKQRGCKISSKGTNLIESRKDGEIHKVPCVGADSVLVKCQKGSCKSLL